MTFNNFEDLIAWQKARELTRDIYSLSKRGAFAKDFGLVDQIRRAAVSIGSNIAEGFDRGNNKEFLVFLGIAKGSAAEVRSQLYTVFDAQYVSEDEFMSLKNQAVEISRLLNGLIKTLRNSSVSGFRNHRSENELKPCP